MNIFKRKSKVKEPKIHKFQIVEYPYSKHIYVTYKENYLKEDYYKGLIKLESDIFLATQCKSIEHANILIKKAKEQWFTDAIIIKTETVEIQ
jgi:hypothetical protein